MEPILKSFTMADQARFAKLSGDYNPMHMNAVMARRTPAGGCVVHGVHALLWALEQLAANILLNGLCALDVDFAQFLYVDETAVLHVAKHTEYDAQVEWRCDGIRISQYRLKFGACSVAPAITAIQPGMVYPSTACTPLPLSWPEVSAAAGEVAYAMAASKAEEMFPHLCKAIGNVQVTSILCLTRLVGMVSPGLHSTFHRLNIKFVDEIDEIRQLRFSTVLSEKRFSVVTMKVRAHGLTGTVKASRRQPPCTQPGSVELQPLLSRDKFFGHTALVIGGSRGIGEVTAKLLAAGGARTIITYANGAEEAKAVVDDIAAAGGSATAVKFDALLPAQPQLDMLPAAPDSVYFFATPRISSRNLPCFSNTLFDRFNQFYVAAFNDTCLTILNRFPRQLYVFYPSTIFVEQAAKNMAEYAMAKAAGEVLAANLAKFTPMLDIDVVRLPRLATDQTASMMDLNAGSVAETMLPIIERIQDRVSAIQNGATAQIVACS